MVFIQIFGVRVNLIYFVIIAAFYDFYHIYKALGRKFKTFWFYNGIEGMECGYNINEHCIALFLDVIMDIIDFFFNVLLIYGAKKVRVFKILKKSLNFNFYHYFSLNLR